jgi:hypothetical protein
MEAKNVRASVSAVISDVNKLAMDWASKHAGELLGTKWYDGEKSTEPSEKWPVSEPVRLAIRQIVTDAFSRETRMSELTERIRVAAGISILDDERAQLIADTEVKLALAYGNLEAWQKTNIVKTVKWLKSMLHTVRDCCDLNVEAGAVPLGHPFPSGDQAPPAHPGCRCTLGIAELIEPKRKVLA